MREDLGQFVDRNTTRYTRRYARKPSDVWTAIVDPDIATLWYVPNPAVELKLGGRWTFQDRDDPYFHGSVTAYAPEHRIEFTYDAGPVTSFTLNSDGDGCLLRYDSTLPSDVVIVPELMPDGYGWREQPGGAGTPQPAYNASWHCCLDGLAAHLAGADPSEISRAARREVEEPAAWRSLVDAYREHIVATVPPSSPA